MAPSHPGSWLPRWSWSNSPQAWLERFSTVAALGGAWLLWSARDRASAPLLTALWAGLLLSSAVLLRRGWLKLFGPVLFYELVRVARRRRYFLLRGLYAFALAGVFLWLYLIWVFDRGGSEQLSAREMAVMSEAFFSGFMLVQFLVVTLLVPAVTGGAIAEEKERKTLEFLLATDLRSREIVLGKLVARLANVTLVVLVGLPILSFLQFFGGIPPDLLLAGFAALGLTVLSLTCLSLLLSVLLKRPRDAILLSYLTVAAYLGLGSLALVLVETTQLALVPVWFGDKPPLLGEVAWWVNAGNIFALAYRAATEVMGNQSLSAVLPGLLGEYFVFHILVALLCGTLAVVRLRAVALRQERPRQVVEKLPLWRRRPLGDRPMLWKELHVEGGVRFGWIGKVVIASLVLASFLPYLYLLSEVAWETFGRYWSDTDTVNGAQLAYRSVVRARPWEWIQHEVNAWARAVTCGVTLLMLIGVSVRAAGGLYAERSRQSLDSLLTTPLESTTILSAKWVGAILCVRWGWLWLAAIWAMALAVGALNVLAVPLMTLSWLVYAAGCSAIGLWFSLVCRTALRATLWTLSMLFMLTAGQWILSSLFLYLPLAIVDAESVFEDLARWQLGITLPAAVMVFGFRGSDFNDNYEFVIFFVAAILGLIVWAFATYALWRRTLTRFRKDTCRFPFQPHRPGTPEPRPAAAAPAAG